MAEFQEDSSHPMMQQQQYCTTHPNQEVTLYCREADCKVPVCKTCSHLDHRGHDLTEFSGDGHEMKSTPVVSDRPTAVVPEVDPLQCTMEFNVPGGPKIPYNIKARVQAVDVNGRKMTTGGAKVEYAEEDMYPYDEFFLVRDNNDGTYTFYRNACGGVLRVTINGTEMRGSPWQ